jgi:ligand-binding sensor domain-containing protein
MPRLTKWQWVILWAGLVLGVSATAFGWRVFTALRISRQEVRAANSIDVVVGPYSPSAKKRFEAVSAPTEFRRAAIFQNHLYMAGKEGLLEYDSAGVVVRQFSVGAELPSSPLVALTTMMLADSREPELIVASEGEGLLAFNGRNFRRFYAQDSGARAFTCLLDGGAGHLLIGTKGRGVLVFDGKRFSVLHSTLGGIYVTALAGNEADLWVGTLNRGALHWHAGTTERFDEAQGLPDPQVLSIATAGDKAYLGTPVGVAVFDRGRFSHVFASGIFAAALEASNKELAIGTEDQGVLTVPFGKRQNNAMAAGHPGISDVRQFLSSGNTMYVLTRQALYRMNSNGFGWTQVLKADPATLTDANISALAVDASGRLWVGYFDRGLDIVPLGSGQVRHVEDERVFCVNRILPEAKTGTIDVATANGLIRFAASGSEEQVLTRNDGLIADHVTDVAVYRDGLALATPAGLTFLDRGGARSLYAFHGLVNNHVYALGVAGDELLAGTLGGLSVVNREVVQTSYLAANSGLKHNWITAVVPVDDGWMVGTYGAGVLWLDRSGHFHSFEKATAPFEVNPNAMLVTREHVFVGSLGHGLYAYDKVTGQWSVITEGLPSANVTALASNGNTIYVGTDNGLVRAEENRLKL